MKEILARFISAFKGGKSEPARPQFKKGDRVYSLHLGYGTVVELDKVERRYANAFDKELVEWDTPPPSDYNNGDNPSFELHVNLRRAEGNQ